MTTFEGHRVLETSVVQIEFGYHYYGSDYFHLIEWITSNCSNFNRLEADVAENKSALAKNCYIVAELRRILTPWFCAPTVARRWSQHASACTETAPHHQSPAVLKCRPQLRSLLLCWCADAAALITPAATSPNRVELSLFDGSDPRHGWPEQKNFDY